MSVCFFNENIYFPGRCMSVAVCETAQCCYTHGRSQDNEDRCGGERKRGEIFHVCDMLQAATTTVKSNCKPVKY